MSRDRLLSPALSHRHQARMWAIALLHCRQDQSANVGFCLLRAQASSIVDVGPATCKSGHASRSWAPQDHAHAVRPAHRAPEADASALSAQQGGTYGGGITLLSTDRPRMNLTATRRLDLTSDVRRNQALRLDDGCGRRASRQQGRGKWTQQVPPHHRGRAVPAFALYYLHCNFTVFYYSENGRRR